MSPILFQTLQVIIHLIHVQIAMLTHQFVPFTFSFCVRGKISLDLIHVYGTKGAFLGRFGTLDALIVVRLSMLIYKGLSAVVRTVEFALIKQISHLFGNSDLDIILATQRTIWWVVLPILNACLTHKTFTRTTHDHIFDNVGTYGTKIFLNHLVVVSMSKV